MAARKPAVAGQFYPGDPRELRDSVAGYIADSHVVPAPERVVAVMSPHAGYIYSGPCAGFAFARVRGMKPKRVLLLGGSHRYAIKHASVYGKGGFDTPLGNFPVDEEFAAVAAKALYSQSDAPHLLEHSLEVQLPFLHVALGTVPIVPILFGAHPEAWHEEAGKQLAAMADDSDLLIASTDLSHYLSEEEANRIDRHTLEVVLGRNPAALGEGLRKGACSMCGGAAVTAAMSYAAARGATEWSLLDYRTSGAVSRDYDRVVGYGAVSMERG